ncbi:hypothetical protein QM565_25665 [Geitlerinema splendidum]|nr:hypothetical protein [Geitlerinema splendidum]
MLKKFIHHSFWIKVSLFGLYFLASVAITYLYISNEQTFYFWDRSVYHQWTIEIAQAFLDSPYLALQFIQNTLVSDYNRLYTIPLIPWVLIGGGSRFNYILGIVLVYQVPFCFILGKTAQVLLNKDTPFVFWSTSLIALINPSLWIPTLRGYPDIGGALFISLFILVYLKNIYLQNPIKNFLMGVLLTLSVLFRRHFAYSALAIFISLCLYSLILCKISRLHSRKFIFYSLTRYFLGVLGVLISSVLSFLLISYELLIYFLQKNHSNLYSSYSLPITNIFEFYISFMVDSFWLWQYWGLPQVFCLKNIKN